jgi:hypothetical protein
MSTNRFRTMLLISASTVGRIGPREGAVHRSTNLSPVGRALARRRGTDRWAAPARAEPSRPNQ